MTASDDSGQGDDGVLAAEDIAALNGQMVARAAAFARLPGIAGAVAVGLGARLAAAYAVARTGGSLTGHQVGDRI